MCSSDSVLPAFFSSCLWVSCSAGLGVHEVNIARRRASSSTVAAVGQVAQETLDGLQREAMVLKRAYQFEPGPVRVVVVGHPTLPNGRRDQPEAGVVARGAHRQSYRRRELVDRQQGGHDCHSRAVSLAGQKTFMPLLHCDSVAVTVALNRPTGGTDLCPTSPRSTSRSTRTSARPCARSWRGRSCRSTTSGSRTGRSAGRSGSGPASRDCSASTSRSSTAAPASTTSATTPSWPRRSPRSAPAGSAFPSTRTSSCPTSAASGTTSRSSAGCPGWSAAS